MFFPILPGDIDYDNDWYDNTVAEETKEWPINVCFVVVLNKDLLLILHCRMRIVMRNK